MTEEITQLHPNHWNQRYADPEPTTERLHQALAAAPALDQRLPVADHDLCATYAQEALSEGRFELAAELSRLAFRARRAMYGPGAAQRDMFGPGADRVRDVPLIGSTRAEHPARPLRTFEPPMSHAPSVCSARNDAAGTECHQPIAWAPGHFGDENREAIGAGWYHLDPEITDHDPVVNGL